MPMPAFPTQSRTAQLFAAIAAGFLLASPAASAEPAEFGLWYDDTGRGAVEIAPCGEQLCGHIVWLENQLNSKGQPLHDIYNPEPKMRDRPICGIKVIGNLRPQSDGTWGSGWVYDPKVGSSYDVEIKLARPDVLEVYGYAGLKILGKSIYWKRAPSDLPRCGDNASPQRVSR